MAQSVHWRAKRARKYNRPAVRVQARSPEFTKEFLKAR
jgi:hypothetical protein